MKSINNLNKRGKGRPRKVSSQNKTISDVTLPIEGNPFDVATSALEVLRETEGTEESDFSEPEANADDNDDDFEADESDDIQIEVDDNDSLEVQAPKKKVRKIKTEKVSKIGNGKSKTSVNKNKTIRSLKDLSSAKDKILRLYGSNEKRLLELAKIKEGYESFLFDFPESHLSQSSEYHIPKNIPCQSENIYDQFKHKLDENKFRTLSSMEDVEKIFKTRKYPLHVSLGDTNSILRTSEKLEFPVFENYRRKGLIYNIGGMVTDVAWLNRSNSNDQYLAVAVSQYFDEPSNVHLRNFDSSSHTSAIQIFKLEPNSLTFEKLQTIIHNYGDAWNLKWHEGYESQNSLGLLCFVCHDGSLKLLEVQNYSNKQEPLHLIYEEIKTSVSIPNNSITCFDFISSSVLICGFKNGYVAEFDILSDFKTPSVYQKIHDSYILSISTAFSNYEKIVVATTSVDGYLYVFDPDDIKTTKSSVGTRFRGNNMASIVYCAPLYAFVYSDGANSLRTVLPRASFAVHQVNSRDSTITSTNTSRLHPLTLSTTSDGSIYIDNITRRLLTGVKNVTNTHKSLRLWKWDYDQSSNVFRLDHNYQVSKSLSNEISKTRIDAHNICISCAKWNETEECGKFYAFANMAGLLTIEKLDSVK